MSDLPRWLSAELDRRALTLDANQHACAVELDRLLGGALPPAIIGAYCYGPPGRGKSLLAALFHEAWPGPRARTHFHAFLRDANRLLVAAPPSGDKLGETLSQWLGDATLLWFDEFHVNDIADALMLAALLRVAIARGVKLIFTSNMAPAALLPDPEFHHRFATSIALLQTHCVALAFDGPIDYRRAPARFANVVAAPCAPMPDAQSPADHAAWLRARFARHGDSVRETDARVDLAGRPLVAHAIGTRVLLCGFDALCGQARSHLDYLDLAARFEVVIVMDAALDANTPRHTLQRLVWLVDILYDRHARLDFAPDRDLEASVGERADVHGIERLWSRLAEMRTAADGKRGA
ncbi:cell division protein ZapE [Burkholderia perseverans]|uniref:cell division protein ZapE n=1 Tax=Burkholderia perseverans TaxID=2615214 RepID=UPI001FEEE625|nr:cell division protein ZapE [Burkholderia perseverans]